MYPNCSHTRKQNAYKRPSKSAAQSHNSRNKLTSTYNKKMRNSLFLLVSLALVYILGSVEATSKRDDFDIVRALLPLYGGLRFDKFINKHVFEKVIVRISSIQRELQLDDVKIFDFFFSYCLCVSNRKAWMVNQRKVYSSCLVRELGNFGVYLPDANRLNYQVCHQDDFRLMNEIVGVNATFRDLFDSNFGPNIEVSYFKKIRPFF